MSQADLLGLGNSLQADTMVLHTTVSGRESLGRISDLVVVWGDKNRLLEEREMGSSRLLVQALMEFTHPSSRSESGYFEFAVEGDVIYASIRKANKIELGDHPEKTISQFWMNSDEVQILRKALHPFDRVEARYHSKLNLIEWRVCRFRKEPDQSQSTFQVFIDGTEVVSSTHQHYADLGDLPFQDWLKSVYRKAALSEDSDDLFNIAGSKKIEEEWTKIISQKEEQQFEEEIRFAADEDDDGMDDEVFVKSLSNEQESRINDRANQYLKNLTEQLISEKTEIQEKTKELLKEYKQNELRASRESIVQNKRANKLEDLLRRKERQLQRQKMEMKAMQDEATRLQEEAKQLEAVASTQNFQTTEGSPAPAPSPSTSTAAAEQELAVFKDKNAQLVEMLSQAQQEVKALQASLAENGTSSVTVATNASITPSVVSSSTSEAAEGAVPNSLQIDELTKKLDRTVRALEAEKTKVKALSERVTVAEKEAQSSAPLLSDLEAKVEHTLKVAQQHKKETEQVKQKLVAAEAEKNKNKNE